MALLDRLCSQTRYTVQDPSLEKCLASLAGTLAADADVSFTKMFNVIELSGEGQGGSHETVWPWWSILDSMDGI